MVGWHSLQSMGQASPKRSGSDRDCLAARSWVAFAANLVAAEANGRSSASGCSGNRSSPSLVGVWKALLSTCRVDSSIPTSAHLGRQSRCGGGLASENAVCGLISACLNGFVSEWMAFQANLLSPSLPQWILKLATPAVGALALSAAPVAGCYVLAMASSSLGALARGGRG